MAVTNRDAPNPSQSRSEGAIPCHYEYPKPPRDAFRDLVKITVGQDSDTRDFQVYRGLLSHHSSLFKRLLAGPLKDSDAHSLPQVNAKVFQIFYDWMFSRELAGEDDAELMVADYIDVYAFADLYMVQRLKDLALDHYLLRYLKDWAVDMNLPSAIYKRTSQTSSLRKLHITLLLETYNFENIRDQIDILPKEFLGDIMEACRNRQLVLGACPRMNGGKAAWIAEVEAKFCEIYHEHPRLDSYPTFVPLDGFTDDAVDDKNQDANDGASYVFNQRPPPGRGPNAICWNCDQPGHISRNCLESKDWSKVQCTNCSDMGHTWRRCPEPVSQDD